MIFQIIVIIIIIAAEEEEEEEEEAEVNVAFGERARWSEECNYLSLLYYFSSARLIFVCGSPYLVFVIRYLPRSQHTREMSFKRIQKQL